MFCFTYKAGEEPPSDGEDYRRGRGWHSARIAHGICFMYALVSGILRTLFWGGYRRWFSLLAWAALIFLLAWKVGQLFDLDLVYAAASLIDSIDRAIEDARWRPPPK